MTIIDALRDPSLIGGLPAFRDLSTWRRWLVFLCALYGLPFSALRAEDEGRETFETGTYLVVALLSCGLGALFPSLFRRRPLRAYCERSASLRARSCRRAA